MLAVFGRPYMALGGNNGRPLKFKFGIVVFVKRVAIDSMWGKSVSLKAMERNAMTTEKVRRNIFIENEVWIYRESSERREGS